MKTEYQSGAQYAEQAAALLAASPNRVAQGFSRIVRELAPEPSYATAQSVHARAEVLLLSYMLGWFNGISLEFDDVRERILEGREGHALATELLTKARSIGLAQADAEVPST